MIMPGVTIGDGAIIAARSLVARDVPPYRMVTGTPALWLERHSPATWWDWPDEQVQALLPQIQQREVALLDVGKQPSRRYSTRTGDLAPPCSGYWLGAGSAATARLIDPALLAGIAG